MNKKRETNSKAELLYEVIVYALMGYYVIMLILIACSSDNTKTDIVHSEHVEEVIHDPELQMLATVLENRIISGRNQDITSVENVVQLNEEAKKTDNVSELIDAYLEGEIPQEKLNDMVNSLLNEASNY